jgi:hypothetical protein
MLADKSKDLPKDEADEAKTEQEKLMNQYSEICKTYRDNKEKEIEDAHNNWVADEAEKHLKQMREKRG